MRVLLTAAFLMVAATAQAENWRVMYWDRYALVALDEGSVQAPKPERRVVRMIRLQRDTGEGAPILWDSIEEADCGEAQVRQRQSQQFTDREAYGVDSDVQPWRDQGDELDRWLLRTLCQKDGLKVLPQVKGAPREEALVALSISAKSPEMLVVDPVVSDWAEAYAALAPATALGGVPSLLAIIQTPHEFAVLGLWPNEIMLASTMIEKVGEDRYRMHVLQVGEFPNHPKLAAQWTFREFDCASGGTRVLTYAGYDDKVRELFGQEMYALRQPFDKVTPDSPFAPAMGLACGREGKLHDDIRMQYPVMVESTMREAIDGFKAYHSPSLAVMLGARPQSNWKDAYAGLCGPLGCRTHPSISLTWKLAAGLLASAIAAVGGLVLHRRRRRNLPSEPKPEEAWLVR